MVSGRSAHRVGGGGGGVPPAAAAPAAEAAEVCEVLRVDAVGLQERAADVRPPPARVVAAQRAGVVPHSHTFLDILTLGPSARRMILMIDNYEWNERRNCMTV